jgi:hypothetical protein
MFANPEERSLLEWRLIWLLDNGGPQLAGSGWNAQFSKLRAGVTAIFRLIDS